MFLESNNRAMYWSDVRFMSIDEGSCHNHRPFGSQFLRDKLSLLLCRKLKSVRTLRGMLEITASCKKYRPVRSVNFLSESIVNKAAKRSQYLSYGRRSQQNARLL